MIVRPLSDADARARWQSGRRTDDPFGDLPYLDALAATGTEVALCVEDEPYAATAVAVRSFGPFRRAGVPPLMPYSPLSTVGGGPQAVSPALVRLADGLSGAFDDVLLLLPPEVTDVRPLQWAGWTLEPRYTYRVDPAVAADPSTWSENPRRTVRMHGSAFRVSEDASHVPDVARLCAASYRRHGRREPLPDSAMATLAGRLAAAGTVRVFAATDRDDVVRAGVVLPGNDSTRYLWMLGSEPGPSMTILLAAVFERLAADGVRVLDLVGANTASIAEFKRRFGPRLVPYHMARATSGRLFRVLRAARSILGS